MKKDTEVRLLMQERRKGTPQRIAAARAGMSERTARKYAQAGQLPSQLKRPHTWVTRPNPFEEDWPWVVAQLQRDPALQGSTLFGLLCERHPGRYRPTQVRTLQRHIARWRAVHGPEQEVIFAQRHTPGERAQSDFTHMEDLGVTIGGSPFPHMVFHLVLTYSNVEAAHLCFSESFEALARSDRAQLVADRRCAGTAPHRSPECRRQAGEQEQCGGLDKALPGSHESLWDATDLEQYGSGP